MAAFRLTALSHLTTSNAFESAQMLQSESVARAWKEHASITPASSDMTVIAHYHSCFMHSGGQASDVNHFKSLCKMVCMIRLYSVELLSESSHYCYGTFLCMSTTYSDTSATSCFKLFQNLKSK